MNPGATTVTRAPGSGSLQWRAAAWIAVSLVVFLALLLGTSMVASRVTSDLDIAMPEREHFAFLQAILFGASLLVALPLIGRALGQARETSPGLLATLPFLLAAITNYLLFEDVRSGHLFETDHALPEIFVPIAIALLGSAHAAVRVAATDFGRRAWSWFSVGAGGVLLACVALTLAKASADLGGMYQLDSPLTFTALAVAAAYAVVAGGRILATRRIGRAP